MTQQVILASIAIIFLLIIVFARDRLSMKNNIILTIVGLILLSAMFAYRLTIHFSYSRLAILLVVIIATVVDIVKKMRVLRQEPK
jgi:hypothetical protein